MEDQKKLFVEMTVQNEQAMRDDMAECEANLEGMQLDTQQPPAAEDNPWTDLI